MNKLRTRHEVSVLWFSEDDFFIEQEWLVGKQKKGTEINETDGKGSNLTICPNEVKGSGTGDQSGAISYVDIYSFGRDVEIFYPKADRGPQTITYQNTPDCKV